MKLFETARLGQLTLNNKIVMAPMTRSRAIGNIPNGLMAQYYAERATAGLIITEGTSPSPNGLGYARIPGLFSSDQAAGWRLVTDAVHANGGRIFMQMMHTGRITHPANLPKEAGGKVFAPSAIAAAGQMWTDDQGNLPLPTPQALTIDEVEEVIEQFVESARLAVNEAGFDGVELHGANGYLIDQFLNPGSNKREDIYGKDRTEFAYQIAARVASAIGGDRVGMRVSPYGTFNDMALFEGTDQFYAGLARRLSSIGLAYIHVIDHGKGEVKRLIRENFEGTYILSQGYDMKRAEADLTEGRGDLVAFGRPFIANPNFVEKIRSGQTLKEMDATKLYTPGPEGYL